MLGQPQNRYRTVAVTVTCLSSDVEVLQSAKDANVQNLNSK